MILTYVLTHRQYTNKIVVFEHLGCGIRQGDSDREGQPLGYGHHHDRHAEHESMQDVLEHRVHVLSQMCAVQLLYFEGVIITCSTRQYLSISRKRNRYLPVSPSISRSLTLAPGTAGINIEHCCWNQNKPL